MRIRLNPRIRHLTAEFHLSSLWDSCVLEKGNEEIQSQVFLSSPSETAALKCRADMSLHGASLAWSYRVSGLILCVVAVFVVVIIIILVVFVLLSLSIDINTGLDARVLTIISFWWSFPKTWSFPKLHHVLMILMISYRGNKWTGTETISMRFSTHRFVSSFGFPCYLMVLTRWARWKRASSWSSKQKRKILEHIRWNYDTMVETKWFCFWVFFPKRSTAHRSSDGISFQNFLFVIDDSGFRAAGVYRSLQKVLTLLCYKTFFVFVFVW